MLTHTRKLQSFQKKKSNSSYLTTPLNVKIVWYPGPYLDVGQAAPVKILAPPLRFRLLSLHLCFL